MSTIINLTCPTCGGKLQITNDIDRFSCSYCGNEHIVQRSGGIVTLAPVGEGLRDVRAGVDRTASELAIKRLEEEVAVLSVQRAEISGDFIWSWVVGGIGAFAILWYFVVGKLLELDGQECFFVAGLIILGLAFLIDNRASARIRARVAPLDQAIAERTAELEKHRAIVKQS